MQYTSLFLLDMKETFLLSMKKEEAFLEEGKVHNNEEITKVEFLELNRRYQNLLYTNVITP